MKKLLIFMLLALCIQAKAQDGFNYASLKSGWINEKAMVFTGSMVFSSKYHGLTEIFAEYYRNTLDTHENYIAGVAFGSVLTRSKNATLRLRAGAGIGTNTIRFIATPLLGLEFSQGLGGIDLILAQCNQVVFWENAANRWRWGFEMGFRVPIN